MAFRVEGAPAVFHKELVRQHLYFGVRAIQYSCRINTVHAVRLQDHLTIPAMHRASRQGVSLAQPLPLGKLTRRGARLALALPPPSPSAWR